MMRTRFRSAWSAGRKLPAHWWRQTLQSVRRRRPGLLKRLAHEYAAVESGRPALSAVGARLESHFQGIGTSLEKLADTSDGVVVTGEKLLQLATGQEDGDDHLHRAIDVLHLPVKVLDYCLRRVAEVIEQLERHQGLINDIRRLEGLMEDVVAPLRFIQVAFRIESAVLEPGVRAVFVSLTRDIEQLHQQVITLFAEQFQSLARAHDEIGALVQRLGPQIRAHRELAEQKKVLLERTLDDLRVALEENRSHDIRLVDAARKLHLAVGRVVGAVQFQDITRQKLQHVDEALGHMGEQLTPDGTATEGAGKSSAAALGEELHEIGAVQAGQLAAVLAELRQAEQTIGEAFTAIVQQADEVDEECVMLRNFRTISVEEDGVVQVVLNSLDELGVLVRDTYTIQSEVYETLRPLAGMASNLTGAMRQLSLSIRLIALNAQIQAAQVGTGTGLEVLSQRTCQIADEASGANNKAAEGLDRLISGFDALVTECKSLQDAVAAQQRWLDGEGGAVKTRLHDYRDRTLNTFLKLGELVGATRNEARDALVRLPFSADTCARLEPLVTAIGALVEQTDPMGAGSGVHGTGVSARLQANYTMASERETHQAIIARRNVPPVAPAVPVPPSETLSPTVAPLPGGPVSPTATPEPAAVAAAAPNLGDNVELF